MLNCPKRKREKVCVDFRDPKDSFHRRVFYMAHEF